MVNFEEFEVFVTITGLSRFPNCRRLEMNEEVLLVRERDNEFDKNAIGVYCDRGKIGYVANSERTVRKGTFSATRLCEFFDETLKAEVVDGTYVDAVCRVIDVYDVDKMILSAFEYYNSCKYEDALSLFLEVGKYFDTVMLLQYTADCCIKTGDFVFALGLIERIIEKGDQSNVTMMMYATSLESTGEYLTASKIYKDLLKEKYNEAVEKALIRCEEKLKKAE